MSYGYDDLDRLTSMVRKDEATGQNQHKSEFVYDGLSRKVFIHQGCFPPFSISA